MAEAIRSTNEGGLNKINQTILDKLSGLKREAYSYLDQALNLDTLKQYNEAVIIYRKCVQALDKAINFVKTENIDLTKSVEANKIYQDLNVMLKKTLDRLELLEKDLIKPAAAAASTANDTIVISDDDDDFLLIGDEVLNNNDTTIDKESSLIRNVATNEEPNASQVYHIENGVQLFYIATDGSVSTPSYPTKLSVYMFNEGQSNQAKGFIRVGNWIYPLSSDKTPAMKTNYNAYIFPNAENDQRSADGIDCKFIGVMFNETVDEDSRNVFEDVLGNFSVLLQQSQQPQQKGAQVMQPQVHQPAAAAATALPRSTIREKGDDKPGEMIVDEDEEGKEKEPEGTAEYLSRNLINGAKFITKGVSATSEYANKYINLGGDKLKTQVKPNDAPMKVDPTVQKCVAGVRYGTHVGVRVSSFLVDKLGVLATKTAQTVAPYIKSGSSKLLTQTGIVKSNDSANQYLENVSTVASSGLIGFSIVYESLETAAKSLAKNIAQESVQVVTHKYGNEAGKVTENTLYSAGNVALTAHNARNLKITKTIAKATAKETINSFSSSNSKQNIAAIADNNEKIPQKKN